MFTNIFLSLLIVATKILLVSLNTRTTISKTIMGRFRLMFSCVVLLGILVFQAIGEELRISRLFSRKLRIQRMESSIADPPFLQGTFAGGENEGHVIGEAPESSLNKMEHHHHSDKSVAGGGVIIGGLVTAIFAAVYCYIRITRKRHDQNHH